jgi:hypothetical protein
VPQVDTAPLRLTCPHVTGAPAIWCQSNGPKFPASRLTRLATCFHAGMLLGLLDPEDGGDSETSLDFQGTTRCYIPGDNTLHNHRCEKLKSYICSLLSVTCLLMVFLLGFHLDPEDGSDMFVRNFGRFLQNYRRSSCIVFVP